MIRTRIIFCIKEKHNDRNNHLLRKKKFFHLFKNYYWISQLIKIIIIIKHSNYYYYYWAKIIIIVITIIATQHYYNKNCKEKHIIIRTNYFCLPGLLHSQLLYQKWVQEMVRHWKSIAIIALDPVPRKYYSSNYYSSFDNNFHSKSSSYCYCLSSIKDINRQTITAAAFTAAKNSSKPFH